MSLARNIILEALENLVVKDEEASTAQSNDMLVRTFHGDPGSHVVLAELNPAHYTLLKHEFDNMTNGFQVNIYLFVKLLEKTLNKHGYSILYSKEGEKAKAFLNTAKNNLQTMEEGSVKFPLISLPLGYVVPGIYVAFDYKTNPKGEYIDILQSGGAAKYRLSVHVRFEFDDVNVQEKFEIYSDFVATPIKDKRY